MGLVPFTVRVTNFRWPMNRSPQHLTYIDLLNQMWARPIDGKCTLVGAEIGLEHGADPDQYAEAMRQPYIDLCRELIATCFPVTRHVLVRGNAACVMANSPDARAIIDQFTQYQGLYCMASCSGTSFKTAPAIDKCLSEWITAGQQHQLTAHRFARRALRKAYCDVTSTPHAWSSERSRGDSERAFLIRQVTLRLRTAYGEAAGRQGRGRAWR